MTISQHDVLSLKGKKNVVFSFVKLCSFAYIEWLIKMNSAMGVI